MTKAVIYASEENLQKIREMGVEVRHTSEDSIIPMAFSHEQIIDEIKVQFNENHICDNTYSKALRKSEKLQKKLFDDTIGALENALGYDGSMNWDDVATIIHDIYGEHEEDFTKKRNAGR